MHKQLKTRAFSIMSKHWHQMCTTGYRSRCVQLPDLMWDIPEVRINCHQLPTEDKLPCRRRVQIASRLRPRIFIDVRCVKVNFLRHVHEWVWGHQRWAWVGTIPTAGALTAPEASRGTRRPTWETYEPNLTPREATPYPEFSCVRSWAPPCRLDAARSYSWLLRCWERRGKIIHFCAALFHPPRTRNGQKWPEPLSLAGVIT